MKDFKNLLEMQEESCKKFKNRPMLGSKINGRWEWMNYGTFAKYVNEIRGGLKQLGVGKGDTVGLISRNSPEWFLVAYATYGLGAKIAPMYENQKPDECAFIVNDSETKILCVYNQDLKESISQYKDKFPKVEKIINLTGIDSADGESLMAIRKLGQENPCPVADINKDDEFTLIYTSGTTGNPKGVVLTHSNMLGQMAAFESGFDWNEEDRSLSLLPWAHILGQAAEVHLLMFLGMSTAFVESAPKLLENLAEVKPTVFIGVPRVYNKIYSNVQGQVAKLPGPLKALFEKAVNVGFIKATGGEISFTDKLALKAIDTLIFKKIRKKLGGRIRAMISGGAALDPDVNKFMLAAGLELFEGYGLSETSPIITFNSPSYREVGSVGKVVGGVKVLIDSSSCDEELIGEGEIIVKGHNVMKGYHNRPDANKEVFNEDGYFRTGDMGRFDENGFLFITGRIKEQYKLQNGKYVVPAPVEEKLTMTPYVDAAYVHGANMEYNICVLSLNVEAITEYLKSMGVSKSEEHTPDHPIVSKLIENTIASMEGVKGYEKPREFFCTFDEWTPENGMLTPSFKIKRRKIIEKYESEINALY